MVIDDFMNKFTDQINIKNHFYHKKSVDFQHNLLYLDFWITLKTPQMIFYVQLKFHAKKKKTYFCNAFS